MDEGDYTDCLIDRLGCWDTSLLSAFDRIGHCGNVRPRSCLEGQQTAQIWSYRCHPSMLADDESSSTI